MSLDIYTPKGKETLLQEEKMLSYISEKWKSKNISIVQTIKKEPADCDGFLIKDNQVIGLFESKCRNLSLKQINLFGSWLITFDKLEKCRQLSLALKIPFLGFLYLVTDDIVLMWKIAENGEYCFDFEVSDTKTQSNVNGGSIIRSNAYLSVNNSTQI